MADGLRRCKSCGQPLRDDRAELYGPRRKTCNGIELPPAPLHERITWYQWDSPDEQSLVRAMVEHCSDGSILWAAVPRLAAYSKLSRRHIQHLLHGLKAEPAGRIGRKAKRGLVERCVLTLLAPASPKRNRPATYRLNEGALQLDPRMESILEREAQIPLLGVHRAASPGEPVIPASSPQPAKQVGPASLPPRAHRALGLEETAAQQPFTQPTLLSVDSRAHRASASRTADARLARTVHDPRAHRAPELNDDSKVPTPTASLKSSLSSAAGQRTLDRVSPESIEEPECKPLSAEDGEAKFIEDVRRLFLARGGVQAAFSQADIRVAGELYRKGVPLKQVDHAIELGCVRKYISGLSTQSHFPIVSLRYFLKVIEEVGEEPTLSLGRDYWDYVHRNLLRYEQQWLGRRARPKENA